MSRFLRLLTLLSVLALLAYGHGSGECSHSHDDDRYEVIIVGAGPSGLQAAMTLGRALVKTLVIDAGQPRNHMVVEFHNFLGQDQRNPAQFRKEQRDHITKAYGESVSFSTDKVETISGSVGDFIVKTAATKTYHSNRIVLATGLRDDIPSFPAKYASLYYRSLFQCPFCHGIEVRGKRFALMTPMSAEHALMMKAWSQDIVVFLNGTTPAWLNSEARSKFNAAKIEVEEGRVTDVELTENGQLVAVVVDNKKRIERDAIYQKMHTMQSELVNSLKLEMTPTGSIKVSQPKLETSVAGIYATGDMVSEMHKVATAVASGCQVAAFVVMDTMLGREAKNIATAARATMS